MYKFNQKLLQLFPLLTSKNLLEVRKLIEEDSDELQKMKRRKRVRLSTLIYYCNRYWIGTSAFITPDGEGENDYKVFKGKWTDITFDIQTLLSDLLSRPGVSSKIKLREVLGTNQVTFDQWFPPKDDKPSNIWVGEFLRLCDAFSLNPSKYLIDKNSPVKDIYKSLDYQKQGESNITIGQLRVQISRLEEKIEEMQRENDALRARILKSAYTREESKDE